jgi:large subunit ribosomal protein L54
VCISPEKDAKSSKKKTSSSPRDDSPQISSEVLSTRCVGANVLKEGEDPLLLSDSEYPKWLWSLLDDPKSDEFGPEQKRLWRRFNKSQARQRNFEQSELRNK